MRIGSLCSGYGGLDEGVRLAFPEASIAWFVEYDKDAAAARRVACRARKDHP